LLVEDDVRLAQLTREYLEKNHLAVAVEHNGGKAVERILTEQPSLVLLDIMLPGKDGMAICREVRGYFDGPIMMFTARDDDLDQLMGLELGADDYVIKPVQPRLLLARIHALLRRSQHFSGNGDNTLHINALTVNPHSREASLAGRPLDLTTAEFDLLHLLAARAGEVCSRDEILHNVRGIGYDGTDRSIDLRISRLRRKLDEDPENPGWIKTVRGKGYLLNPGNSD